MENTTLIQTAGRGANAVQHGANVKYEIKDFVAAVNAGCEGWALAGKILVKMHGEDSRIIARINKQFPFLSIESLEIFYQIGLGSLWPMTLLLPKHVLDAVRCLPVEKQKLLCEEPVELVTRISGDKPVIERKSCAKLRRDEIAKCIGRRGVIPVAKQLAKLKAPRIVTGRDVWPNEPEAPAVRVPVVVARFAVRRGVGGVFVFEKTTATNAFAQQVRLTDGQALLELTEYKD